ncbi:unnamed protein product, partial [Medioppia subpectinata]
MEKNYGSATACVKDKCNLELEPDYDELKEAWVNWRASAGKPVRELYKEYVSLGNRAAVKNGFKTLDDLWLFPWETTDIKDQMEGLWLELEGMYKKLHTFIRMKLKKHYGDKMPSDGTIPAHLLGNMWAQSWGLIGMPDIFWNKTVFVKPDNKKMVCHASAWDFFDQQDFRVKMCTDVTMEELITIHHEMGHIEYYLQYRDQPVVFREGANPGFHEAVGDLLALSVSTPGHLNKVGLYSPLVDDHETTLNYQMSKALAKIAFLPFGYLMDLWRWDVFSGKTSSDELNKKWWELRIKYQGL